MRKRQAKRSNGQRASCKLHLHWQNKERVFTWLSCNRPCSVQTMGAWVPGVGEVELIVLKYFHPMFFNFYHNFIQKYWAAKTLGSFIKKNICKKSKSKKLFNWKQKYRFFVVYFYFLFFKWFTCWIRQCPAWACCRGWSAAASVPLREQELSFVSLGVYMGCLPKVRSTNFLK